MIGSLVIVVGLFIVAAMGCNDTTSETVSMKSDSHKWFYSFYFHTRNLGKKVHRATDPFTGEARDIPIDDGLTASERKVLGSVLAKHGFKGPEPEGEGYALYLAEGQRVRVRDGDLMGTEPITGFAVEVTVLELTDEVLGVLLDLAKSGNLAFTSETGDNVRIVSRAANDS